MCAVKCSSSVSFGVCGRIKLYHYCDNVLSRPRLPEERIHIIFTMLIIALNYTVFRNPPTHVFYVKVKYSLLLVTSIWRHIYMFVIVMTHSPVFWRLFPASVSWPWDTSIADHCRWLYRLNPKTCQFVAQFSAVNCVSVVYVLGWVRDAQLGWCWPAYTSILYTTLICEHGLVLG